jgi:hypothetical protein
VREIILRELLSVLTIPDLLTTTISPYWWDEGVLERLLGLTQLDWFVCLGANDMFFEQTSPIGLIG